MVTQYVTNGRPFRTTMVERSEQHDKTIRTRSKTLRTALVQNLVHQR